VLDGAALETARALPARYAVRWLVLLARVKRRLGPRQAPAVAALLAEAAALAPTEGWPELALIVGTEQALDLDPAAAFEALGLVASQARQRQLHGAELGALLHQARLAAGTAPEAARQAAHAALDLAKTTEALHTDRAWRWLAPALALCAADASEADQARGAVWAQAGQQWLRTTATTQVAPEFADGFLHQHPVNQALLAWRLVTPGPAAVTGP
jgi:hypothetical protein